MSHYKGRGNILEIPLDDAVVVQILHAGQDGARDKTKRISLSLLSPGKERANVPKQCYGISFREVSALAETFKEFSADSELESKVVFYPRPKQIVGFDLQRDNQTCQGSNYGKAARVHGGEKKREEMIEALDRLHLVPYHFLIPLGILHDLQYDLACHVLWHRQSRGIPRGEGERGGG